MSEAPPALRSLQRCFLQALLDDDPALEDRVRGGPGLSPRRRVDLYRNAYRSRLVEALQALLPMSAAWLGADPFEAAATAYVAEHPPSTWRLDDYGHDFGDWLLRQDPDWRAVADLARLEVALRRVFDAPDADTLSVAALLELGPDDWLQAVVDFVPACIRLCVTEGSVAAWHCLQAGERPATPREDDPEVALLVWRRDGRSGFRTLDPLHATLAERLASGESFAAAGLAAGLDATGAATALFDWTRESLIASLRRDARVGPPT
ncbi:MAG: DNA-binding domain-containing protein [Xanthomonadales bacterium]|jgi:hypothetical protein|nr:DNA-binding domain-containing protein [Xanthomonadales bacterium]